MRFAFTARLARLVGRHSSDLPIADLMGYAVMAAGAAVLPMITIPCICRKSYQCTPKARKCTCPHCGHVWDLLACQGFEPTPMGWIHSCTKKHTTRYFIHPLTKKAYSVTWPALCDDCP